ncbi:MAG: YceI family protein [Rhodospirillaceae bacterium]|nr:YceI family protein [Rhodospirillaceae bacterium]
MTRKLLVVSLLMYGLTVIPARASCLWRVDQSQSVIEFVASMQGAEFTGRFGSFDAHIDFDPAQPDQGQARVTVPLSTVDTQFEERDAEVKKADWFDVERFPQAVYAVSEFIPFAPGEFTAKGSLTLRGQTLPVPLRFKLKTTGARTEMTGETAINRLDFGLGWPATEVVGNPVKIRVSLVALRDPQSTCTP